jgi:Icc-related predicted phosphoesterase
MRVAAVGDLHVGTECKGRLRADLEGIGECADVLLLAGDLTRCGTIAEVDVLVEDLEVVDIPVVAVLGNHDHHADSEAEVTACLESAGVTVLEGTATTLEVDGATVGIAGTKGFGGGFAGASGSAFGEREMKAFMEHSQRLADSLHDALASLETDVRIALLHYAPIEDTLRGERLEIYPFLGSWLLAEAIDRAGADVAFHGHAHAGRERGTTAGGIKVRNVAQPVLGRPYRVYSLDPTAVLASA